MRRADRLFQIIQILRRARRRPTTADEIAGELEISKRSVYRDIAQLIAQRVPVRGEAGIGYVLEDGFHMPPLMLTPEELEAALLGAQWVSGRGDRALARAASDFIAKIGAVIPERLQPYIIEPTLTSPNTSMIVPDAIDTERVRAAIHAQTKIVLFYRDESSRETERTIWPIGIGYFAHVRCIIAWCELRQAFRSFRTDRVREALFLEQRYPQARTRLRADYRKQMMEERTRWEKAGSPARGPEQRVE